MIELSPREQQVYALLIQGYGYKKMAAELKIAKRTVYAHIANMREKAHCTTNAQLVYKMMMQDIARNDNGAGSG